MQPYQNTNFYGQYQQPQFNPYMQRMENLQQFQQAIQQPMVPTSMSGANQLTPLGKIVESIDIVKATDIPMDGNMYYFPKADGSELYSKQWLSNGQTRILIFKPISDDSPINLSSDKENAKTNGIEELIKGIQSDIKTLTDKVDKISKPTRAKKEMVEDE